jgi:hypothetical protein
MPETKKPKKIAYVRQGRSILTKLGCAQAGAPVTPDMISAGTPESQLTIWYREIRADNGTLELPKKLKTILAEDSEGQLSLETLFGDDQPADEPSADKPLANTPPADEPPADEPPADEPLADEPPADEPPADEPPADEPPVEDRGSRPRKAARKRK